MERSYIASKKGLEVAKQEFKKKGWTQQILADLADCSRPVVSNFLKGKAIDKQKFINICEALKLEWIDIVEIQTSYKIHLQEKGIDELVEEIRTSIKNSVEKECGTMRVLDMSRPIELNDIYTQVNILEKIIGRRGFNLDELFQNCNLEKDEFDRFGLNKIKQKRVLGLKAVNQYDKLMILGKPGVGKTMFLKYLAIQCTRGEFVETKIPIFIPLKKYAEAENSPDLSSYMIKWLKDCKITNASEKLERILTAGRGLILLDGLDEVKEEDNERVIRNIENFYNLYHKNQFAVTCRIAAKEYTFTQFTEVEVADFDDEQIKNFVNSWFKIKQLPEYPKHFLEQLKNNSTIKELANNPLLLTLLCLEFEDSGNFPSDRADLYARATNTLLRKWDDKRYIYRQQVYKELTPKRKEGLLSQIAFKTFDKKEYFFKQRTIESYIGEYICNLPTAPKEQTKLDIDSQGVLKSIEAQHGLLVERARGIYSFSHLTFQEYFTSRKIANISNPNELENALISLAGHVFEKRWKEVFLLTATLLEPADRLLLLMKHNIDKLLANETRLQEYLVWVRDKSNSVEADQKIAVIRQFYYSFDPDRDLDRDLQRDLQRDYNLHRDRDLQRDYNLSFSLYLDLYRDLSFSLNRSLSNAIQNCVDGKLKEILEKLQQQLPDSDEDKYKKNQWWKNNSAAWRKELREAMIKYRNIGHEWNFNQQQIDLLKQYLTANQLLMKCLNSECYVSREVREEIEDTLFLPFADLNYD
ncbi:NACHT domain-containing NTPase [Crocosphaera sp.]|uniref:NACHT domain-containing protein n=1 Tax=Crocosphaera sp. TaxID=2729996 RepID=UPI00260DC95C|nr:NACHT domain-containing NTPase [Crocosphaera sp.]MDJ0580710.1 NACHT domain-containing NTPase [Crocosphaera sp.]